MEIKFGLSPAYDENSRVLILGSFPSVKSREVQFYYGNKQNRFWKTLCGFFGEEIPTSTQEKNFFLKQHNIALWDMVVSCAIVGSQDSTIQEYTLCDLSQILQTSKIQAIFLNGTAAYQLFLKKYCDLPIPYCKLCSTSPANPRFQASEWYGELDKYFNK